MKKKFGPFHRGFINKFFLIISIAVAIMFLVPFYWMIINSLMPNSILLKVPPPIIPKIITLDNYLHVFSRFPLARWMVNSFFVSGITAIVAVYIASLGAYPLAKKKFPGVFVLFWIPVAFMAVPRTTVIIPLFMTMLDLKLFDNYIALLLPSIATPFGLFMMKQFMQTVPDEIIDAAKIDGSGELRMFHSIILPIVKPSLGALLIFSYVGSWNEFLWQLIIIRSPEMKTVPLGLTSFVEEFSTKYGYLMSAAVIGAIPMIVFFMLFQKYFVSGLTVGSVKG